MKDASQQIKELPAQLEKLKGEIAKVIVGQHRVIHQILIALLCRSHALLVGVPGLAKTMLVESFAQSLDLNFNRVQFTPDLMPSDITGNEILQEDKSSGKRALAFIKGPVFTHILLGDEINRTPPKTQSALLQAMQEKKVTAFGNTQVLDEPFMVLATQNPIEQEGTYPLPEAQLDRFLFCIDIQYPSEEDEISIVKKHTTFLDKNITPVLNRKEIIDLQELILSTTVSEHVYEYAVKIIRATRPGPGNSEPMVNKYIQWGAGPRATHFLILAAKGNALLHGRPTPSVADVNDMLYTTLNHRIILNFNAEAEGIAFRHILDSLLKKFQ